jgi:hypothetical protein
VLGTGGDKTYDGTNTVGGSFVLGNDRITNDVVTQTGTSMYTNVNAGNRTISTTGITLGGADAANYTLASSVATNGATISLAALDITATDQTKTYGSDVLGTTGFTSSGLQNGETIGGVTLSAVDINGLGVSSSGNHRVGIWGILGSAATGGTFNAANYGITYATTGRLTITPRALTVSSSGGDKTYDATTAVVGSYALSNDRIAGDVVTQTAVRAYTNGDVGTRTISTTGISISGADAANYLLGTTSLSHTATISPRALTVVTVNQSATAGSAAPVFTGSNNLLASDAALISWLYAPLGSPTTVGSYSILATAVDAYNRLANYVRSNSYGLYTITPPTTLPTTVTKVSQGVFTAPIPVFIPVVANDRLYTIKVAFDLEQLDDRVNTPPVRFTGEGGWTYPTRQPGTQTSISPLSMNAMQLFDDRRHSTQNDQNYSYY